MELFFHALAIILLFSSLLHVGLKLWTRSTACQNLPPGTSGWPILGETLEFIGANLEGCADKFVCDRIERYGSTVFRTSLFGQRVAFLCGPAGNKFLFSNEGKKVHLWIPAPVRWLFGRSLLFMTGDEASVRRKLLMAGFFNTKTQKQCVPTVDMITRAYFETHWQGKEVVQVWSSVKLFTFEVTSQLFMSITEPELISRILFQFNIFLKGLAGLPFNIPGTRFYRGMRAADMLRIEIQAIVRQRRVELERMAPSPAQDILSYFLVNPDENGKFMTEADIVNEMLALLFAGHDTTTSTISLLIKYLAEQPKVHKKVLQEQRYIAASKEPGELLTWEDLQNMKYSWDVVSEVLRIAPPAAGSFRVALDDIVYEGYTIPKGWKLWWSAAYTHKDPRSYENEKEFDESRFEGAGPRPFSYVPFGGGSRMCMGKEYARLQILTFLHNLVNRFDGWDLLVPDEKLSYDPNLLPKNGLPIHPRPRISD